MKPKESTPTNSNEHNVSSQTLNITIFLKTNSLFNDGDDDGVTCVLSMDCDSSCDSSSCCALRHFDLGVRSCFYLLPFPSFLLGSCFQCDSDSDSDSDSD